MMKQELTGLKCKPCEGMVTALEKPEIDQLMGRLSNGWYLNAHGHLENQMHFVNFRHTMNMVNKIASLAEEEGHHPNLSISYGKLDIEIWTHAIGGLTENDFILAAKIDLL